MLNWGDFWEHTRSHFVGSVTTSVIYLPICVFKSDDLRIVHKIVFISCTLWEKPLSYLTEENLTNVISHGTILPSARG